MFESLKNFFRNKNQYLDIYKISGTVNLDKNVCFSNIKTYPNFQIDLEKYKLFLKKNIFRK